MPVFVSDNHLLYDLLNILIGRFHCAIHLWTIQRRVVVLDLELRAKLSDYGIVEVGTIVRDDSLRDAIATDKVMLYEPGDQILSNKGEQGCFNPFYKVVNGDENEAMSVRSSRLDFSDHINAQHYKRLRSSHDIQRNQRHVNLVSINLALVASP